MADPADVARLLASIYFQLSLGVDAYREAHFDALTPAERATLKDLARQLDDASDQFTAEAIAATLASIQDSLAEIMNVTTQAQQSLKNLKTTQEVLKVASAAISLGMGIMGGNAGAIAGALGDLAAAAKPEPAKSAQGS